MVTISAAILIFIIIVLSLLYLLSNREKNTITSDIRAKAQGTYVSLSDGVTHYQIHGPDSGQTVILIHGMTIPDWTWDFQVPALVEAGFRVLMYDHYGRGYSDRPHMEYNQELYLRQLCELLDKLQINSKLHLIGSSMGGAIAINFAAHYPQRVQKIVLFSPLINGGLQRAKIFRPKLIGEFMMRVIGISYFINRCVSYYEGTEHVGHYEQLFREQISYKGFEYSFLNLFRTDALGDYREAYSAVAAADKPVLLICGRDDPEISRQMMTELKTLIPYTQAHILEGVGHGISLHLEADRVNPLLVDFLKK
ncbi:MAG TPA: alpha/beta hydrolase [Chitinispirillaceae bacterium]|nr:alpha/beta hydrolase [Chitinispirillaceae bacterium]